MISSSLFHFTRKISNLKLILRDKKFRASYNIENVQSFFPNESYLAIPMVCFCDIPLKFITQAHHKGAAALPSPGRCAVARQEEEEGIHN